VSWATILQEQAEKGTRDLIVCLRNFETVCREHPEWIPRHYPDGVQRRWRRWSRKQQDRIREIERSFP
jgi:hypothetical protein